MFATPQWPLGLMNKPTLTAPTPSTSAGSAGYFLEETWMTGLGSSGGLHRVDRVDESTIAVSRELEKKYVVAVKDLKGETLWVINMGNEQIRGMCVIDLHKTMVIVVTKAKKIELWNPLSGKIINALKIPNFDPCAVCQSTWDTILVANWAQSHPDMDRRQPETNIVELQATETHLKRLDHRLTVDLRSVISMVKSHKILVMTSFNNDVVMAVDYLTGNIIWKLTDGDFEDVKIRPNGLCSDEAGYIYVADTALPYCRIFVIAPLGQIIKKVLNTSGWCDDITWINEDRKLVVLHDKSGLNKQDISIYTVDKLPKPRLTLDGI